ncbi:MAG TPA: hypothetical protein VLD57_12595, partial [Blastocatellia bacterium]|nr:hypothetical protein [Blastocatellia bacterium]
MSQTGSLMEILRLDINRAEPDAPSESEVRLQSAMLAAIAATGLGLILRFVFDAPLVPELLTHLIFAVAPIWVVEIAVGMLGPFAKHLGFLGCVLAYTLALTGTAYLLRSYENKVTAFGRGGLPILVFSTVLWAATLLIIIPMLGGGIAGRYLRQGTLYTSLSQLLIYAAYGAALAAVGKLYLDRPDIAREHNTRFSRRRVMRGVFYTVIAVAAYDMGKSLFTTWWRSGSGRIK